MYVIYPVPTHGRIKMNNCPPKNSDVIIGKSDVIISFKWRHHVMLYLSVISDFSLIIIFCWPDSTVHDKGTFLTHQIEIFAGFVYLKKFYLTYHIPTGGKDKILTAARRPNSGLTLTPDFIVMLKWRQHVTCMLHLSVFKIFWKFEYKMMYLVVSKKWLRYVRIG